MGGHNTIVLHNTCEDSLLAAPLIIDLVIISELCERIQVIHICLNSSWFIIMLVKNFCLILLHDYGKGSTVKPACLFRTPWDQKTVLIVEVSLLYTYIYTDLYFNGITTDYVILL